MDNFKLKNMILNLMTLEKEILEFYHYDIKGLSIEEKTILFDEFCFLTDSINNLKNKAIRSHNRNYHE